MPPQTSDQSSTLAARLTDAVDRYTHDDDLGRLIDTLRALAREGDVDALREATAAHRDRPEVVIPIYESIVERAPGDAQAMVLLANAYWLTGRGPDLVGSLADRARTVDPDNRGAWHLWALAESNVRSRMERWQQVAERFPQDQLARAALADNAASLAGAEHDPLALDLAIRTFEGLLAEATHPAQRAALESTLKTLRGWKL